MFNKEVSEVGHFKRNGKDSLNRNIVFCTNDIKQVLVLFIEGCDGYKVSKVELQMNSDVMLFEIPSFFKGTATARYYTTVLYSVIML